MNAVGKASLASLDESARLFRMRFDCDIAVLMHAEFRPDADREFWQDPEDQE